jgi:hypothetical protein
VSVPLLDIPLRPSRIFAAGLGLLYGVTGLLLIFSSTTLGLKTLLLCGLVGLAWRVWREWRLLRSVQRLHVLPQSYRLITTSGEMELFGGYQTLVTRRLVILHLRNASRTLRLPLLWDTAAADDLRRLRVWLSCRK